MVKSSNNLKFMKNHAERKGWDVFKTASIQNTMTLYKFWSWFERMMASLAYSKAIAPTLQCNFIIIKENLPPWLLIFLMQFFVVKEY
jgi:hypothetical protein